VVSFITKNNLQQLNKSIAVATGHMVFAKSRLTETLKRCLLHGNGNVVLELTGRVVIYCAA